jgi:uncharacterized damage-inducible protein DinB
MPAITPEWVQMMASYNRWQNECMLEAMESLSDADLRKDRGAFWGSILGTANHLLWGDQMWLSRLSPGATAPTVGLKDSADLAPTLGAWEAERFRTDGRFVLWAKELKTVSLAGDLSWYSGAAGMEKRAPLSLIVTHVFNHQTHHRGQIHAMLTQAGAKTSDTDLFLMPGFL